MDESIKTKVVSVGHKWGKVVAAVEDGKVKESSLTALDGDDLKDYLDAKLFESQG